MIEEPGLPSPKGGEVDWTTDVQANHPLTVTRKIRLPSVEGEYGGYALIDLQAWIHVAGGMVVDDGLIIYVTREGGKVYYSGTPIPINDPGRFLYSQLRRDRLPHSFPRPRYFFIQIHRQIFIQIHKFLAPAAK